MWGLNFGLRREERLGWVASSVRSCHWSVSRMHSSYVVLRMAVSALLLVLRGMAGRYHFLSIRGAQNAIRS